MPQSRLLRVELSFHILRLSPRTQADARERRSTAGPATASGPKAKPLPPRPANLPSLALRPDSFLSPRSIPTGPHPHAGNEAPGPEVQNPRRIACLRRGTRGRERLDHAQARVDVRHPQAARPERNRNRRRGRGRGAAGRVRVPPLAGSELSARPGRHLRLAVADPAIRSANR